MSVELTDALCTQCGLCCDGSLFADVELSGPAEATRVELLGLDVEEDGDDRPLLVQPCTALDGTRCSVYEHRPECCRTFECKLLQETARGTVSLDHARAQIAEALVQINRVKALLGPARGERLSLSERCAMHGGESVTAAMAVVEHLVQQTFLGGSDR